MEHTDYTSKDLSHEARMIARTYKANGYRYAGWLLRVGAVATATLVVLVTNHDGDTREILTAI